jgi:hypothetical protein
VLALLEQSGDIGIQAEAFAVNWFLGHSLER